MYLSQLVLDPQARRVLDDLADPYQLHRTVMSGFPAQLPAGERVLFRLEMQRSEPCLHILVQSHTPPNWEALAKLGCLLRQPAIKAFELQISAGGVFRFRLAANPTRRLRCEDKEHGMRIGLEREEDQFAWLDRKGEQHGFRVLAVQAVKLVQPDGRKFKDGKNHRIRQLGVCFDGRLQVTGPAAFIQALEQGIGSAKGFGFGLLSLAAGSS